MKATIVSIEDKVDELLVCLDQDVRYMQENLQRLNEIRRLVIKRDEAALGKLLESIQAAAGCYREHELNRKSIRKELAYSLGLGIGETTLSALRNACRMQKKTR